MPIAEDSAGGSPVPIPTNLTTNLTGEATGSGTLDYTTGDIDIVVTVVDNGHNHILENITDVQVNNAISGQVLKYNGNVWVNGTDENAGITAIVQDLTPQLGGNLDLNNRNITGTGNIAITGTIDGRDVSADGTKLDGIESGATADQTAAQIKTAYESNANTNNFADADVSKLSGIEPGATADQTAAQIKTAYESNADTNAFTDADHTKLDGIETAADVTDTTNVVASLTAGTNVTIAADGTISATGGTSGIAHVVDDTTPQLGGNLDLNSNDITGTGNLNFTGSVTLSGTVDGRDVAADGTKLDGIEASADVTDTANVTAAGALMDSEVTNLAQVKAFDSSDYATAAQGTTADAALPKAGGTMTGALTVQADATFTGGGTGSIVINDEDNSLCPTMTFLRNGGGTTTNDFIKFENSGGEVASINSTGGALFRELKVSGSNTRRLDISNTTLADTGEMASLQWDNSANFTIQGRTSAGGFAANWYSIQTTDTDGRADAHIFYTDASTERMRIDSGGIDVTGKIGVGDANTVADHELHIQSSSPTIRLEDTDGNKRFDITQSGNDTNFDFESNIIYKKADGTEVARIDTDGIDVSGDILLDSDNAEINLKSGITGTSGAVNWTFNTTTTNYASLNLNYDTRATTGFHIDSGYPITIDSSGIGTRFAYGGTEQMRLTNTGRLGIGTTGPSSLLHLASTAPYITFEDTDNNQDWQIQATAWFAIRDQTANAERMRIDSSGRVGVGHTSPVAKMAILGSSNSTITEANSNLCVEGSGGNGMLFGTLSTTGFKSYIQSGFVSNLGTATYDLLLNPEGGNTGIGTSAPTAKLSVAGGVTVSTNLNVGNATPAGGGTIESHVQSSSTPALITYSGSSLLRTHISFENSNGQVGKINTTGTQTFYVTSSDYRLKTDIQPMQGSIDRVKALKPCNFEWVNDGGRVDGFIAHEAQEVVPEAIVGDKDAMQDQQYVESEATGDIYTPAIEATYETIQVELTPAVDATYDEDGNELTPAVDATYEEQQQELTPAVDEIIHSSDVVEPDELEEGQLWRQTTEKVMATRQVPDYQGIDQSKIVPLLTSALQDAIAKIEALETRLEALES